MYWNPFDSAHSGRINSWAAILGFILAGRLWVVGFFFFFNAGVTRVQAVIDDLNRVVYRGVTSSFFGIGILPVSDLLDFRYFGRYRSPLF